MDARNILSTGINVSSLKYRIFGGNFFYRKENFMMGGAFAFFSATTTPLKMFASPFAKILRNILAF